MMGKNQHVLRLYVAEQFAEDQSGNSHEVYRRAVWRLIEHYQLKTNRYRLLKPYGVELIFPDLGGLVLAKLRLPQEVFEERTDFRHVLNRTHRISAAGTHLHHLAASMSKWRDIYERETFSKGFPPLNRLYGPIDAVIVRTPRRHYSMSVWPDISTGCQTCSSQHRIDRWAEMA